MTPERAVLRFGASRIEGVFPVSDSRRTQLVFAFGERTDGRAGMRNLLGGKGANLAEMARIGLPVPPGFTISTDVCTYYSRLSRESGELREESYPPGLAEAVRDHLTALENAMGKSFGAAADPLLVSVRSGARESMPGMMDTILNLGLNDETVAGLAAATDDPRFAYDCYRRFIHMYAGVVLGVGAESDSAPDPFEALLDASKREAGVESDTDLDAESLARLIVRYKDLVQARAGTAFPQDVDDQLWGAIGAVFASWHNERAVIYRQRYGIPSSPGTAVNVQAMVFGNRPGNSGTGVAFTRDPATGAKTLYGEYLMNAQGEDVVAGTRTPEPVAQLERDMPSLYRELAAVAGKLERHFGDMQDFEFTIDDGRLFLLQTRAGKRTGLAAVRIAVDMQAEDLLDRKSALMKIPADSIDALLSPTFDPRALAEATEIARGLPAGPGAATGRIVFTSAEADRLAKRGERMILCRTQTNPEDLKGMLASEGFLTTRGGVSSHAALVARQLGKACVCGAAGIAIDYAKRTLTAGGRVLREGDAISLDGFAGVVYQGEIATSPSEVRRVLAGEMKPEDSTWYGLYRTVMSWADRYRRLAVRTNADSPAMAAAAVRYGAEGIGLCRTEHMFFEADRIDAMRQMILADDEAERRRALAKLLPYQRGDFEDLFVAMAGRPVTIRLLDPPLHEFLPAEPEVRRALAAKLGLPEDVVEERVDNLTEVNPMLGCRGCRLGILYPEITETQARAIFEAAIAATARGKATPVRPEIMVPLVGFREELAHQAAIIRRVAGEVMAQAGTKVDYQIGTMIEVPRAALAADGIAEVAEFFSFGTNDLTQMTLGLSRDDMGSFFDRYRANEIYAANPFARIDEPGVGRLIQEAVRLGRSTRNDLKIGICGEHGGDPASIAFCEQAGLDYVSCSPPRVPVARLAAAQAALASRPTLWTP